MRRKAPTLAGKTVSPEDPRAGGQVDIWAILAADPAALAREIDRGDHDAYLSYLHHCEMSRERRQRPEVLVAVKSRIARRA